jgi:hypothetical protein
VFHDACTHADVPVVPVHRGIAVPGHQEELVPQRRERSLDRERAVLVGRPTYVSSGRSCTSGRPLSTATALCPASTTAVPGRAALMTVVRTNSDCSNAAAGDPVASWFLA